MSKIWLMFVLLLNVACGIWAVFWPLSNIVPIIGCLNFMVAGGLVVVVGLEL